MPLAVQAGVTLHVNGLDEDVAQGVKAGVQLSQYTDRDVTEAQVRHLYGRAPDEARQALRPYGYFDADVDSDLTQHGDDWVVTLSIDKGKPVRVTELEIGLSDAVTDVPRIHQAIESFAPAKGEVLNQGHYRDSRNALNAALHASGYLDAELTQHEVRVTRAEHSAVINLAWDTGTRYRFGEIHFKGSQFRDGFLDRYIPWDEDAYYDQGDLLALQRHLNGADYFSVVNVTPDTDDTHDDHVDIDVDLKPDKRSVYTGGPFIGSDTGIGVQAGLQRRWVNDRGHKWRHHIVLAQRLKMLDTRYTIPLAGSDQRAWNFGAKYRDADTETSHSQTLELIANQTWLTHGWLATAGMHALSGTYTVGKHHDEPDSLPGIERGDSTLVFPEVSLVKKHADNTNFVHHGWSLTLTGRGTIGKLLSDTDFLQFTADGKWIHAFSPRNRFIARAKAGVTDVGDFHALHPQLRFFAGGSRSNRGYGYQALGPRNDYGRVIGGDHLLTTGFTFEHYFTDSWGMAAFVDAGDAFDGTRFSAQIGAGLGVRWRSPVGMIRLDLGTPIHNERHDGVQLNLLIGPDL